MIRSSQIETARASGAAPAAPPGGAQFVGGRGCGLGVPILASLSRSGLRCVLSNTRTLSNICALSFCAVLLVAATDAARADEVAEGNLPGAFVPVTVPSGQQVLLSEVLLDDSAGALWARFRFVAPQISNQGDSDDPAKMDYESSAGDMDHLCESLALDYLRQHAVSPQMVVISFADRPVEFGSSDAEATQFFEAYRPEGERCIWEAF